MRVPATILLLLLCHTAPAQLRNTDPDETEQRNLEDLAESTQAESEDEYDQQQMSAYKNHPLNINGPASALQEFPLLEALQIDNLIRYRSILGDLISVYELQAVPGFSADLIKKMLPYITISNKELTAARFIQRLHNGDRTCVVRPSLIPEKSLGFSQMVPISQQYQGVRWRMLARYKYQFADLLQYGIVADQDAGERFRFGQRQLGFDFYSAHLFARRLGLIKSFALGDYTVNLGQGLIQWQSQAFNKSSQVINIKRQSETLRPYHSAGEYNFFRGLGLTMTRGKFETTLFGSYRNLSANVQQSGAIGRYFTSVQTSGLHRTLPEIEDRNVIAMIVAGGNMQWKGRAGHLGLNAVAGRYSLPLLRRNEPYNLFAMKGNSWGNYSFDYSLTVHNYHFFGELATDKRGDRAVVSGLMTSLAPAIDVAILYRSISPGYQSIFGNAFTESTMPTNENGLYLGMSAKISSQLKIDLYADVFRFPWLRYGMDAPGFGCQYLGQVGWQPNKKVSVYSRMRIKLKPGNGSAFPVAMHQVQDNLLSNWRTNISFQCSRDVTLRNRIEFCWFGVPQTEHPQTGSLVYMELLYKPIGRSWSAVARLQVFQTDGYDTRIYAYESDVLFASSTPAFFDNGARFFVNLKTKVEIPRFNHYTMHLGAKISSSVFATKSSIGSGPDQITGKHRSELKFQLLFGSD